MPDWTVSGDRELPLEMRDSWDGDAAADRIMREAGWDPDDEDAEVDTEFARRGFVYFNSDGGQNKNNYKSPFADIIDGDLRAIKGGVEAADQFNSRVDVPEDVKERGQNLIDHYQDRIEEEQGDNESSYRETMENESPKIGERFYRHVTTHVRQPEGTDNVIFEISNEQLDRHGTKFDLSGVSLDNYRNNPVVLWNHGARPFVGGVSVPIGRTTNIQKRGSSLFAEVQFDQDDEFARTIERKVRNGFLNAASVGFIPKSIDKGEDREDPAIIEESELLEWSVVPVPSNPGALVSEREQDIYGEMWKVLEEKVRQLVEEQVQDRSIKQPIQVEIDGEEIARAMTDSLPERSQVADLSSDSVDEKAADEAADSSTDKSLDKEAAIGEETKYVQLSLSDLKELTNTVQKAKRKKLERKAERKYKRLTGRA